jgi:hypothetical protein
LNEAKWNLSDKYDKIGKQVDEKTTLRK